MGTIGRELIRLSQERIIALERELDALPDNQGWDERKADIRKRLSQERSALDEKIRLENGDV